MIPRQKTSTKAIAISGVLLAFNILFLYAASIVPGVELTLYLATSLLVAAVIIEIGPAAGWLFYLLSVIVCILVIPNKTALFPYVMFFGVYGILKFHIEKINRQVVEIILKLITFAATCGIGVLLFRELFLGNVTLPNLPGFVLWILAALFFLLYDYIFTMAIGLYQGRIHRFLG